MNCPNCGTNNLDNASVCVNCGRSLMSGPTSTSYTPPPPPPPAGNYGGGYAPGPAGVPPSNTAVIVYLVLSIIQLLCCCNPVALVPLIFAIMSTSRRNAGDYAGAELNSRRAALWFWISIGALIIFYILWFGFFGGMAIFEEIRRAQGR
ncbi:MAG TPA: CD225/dispanin family protein [Thermoanaerobaculia bacterium]|nr:CD225/dispanin family protein [Thermoanaerobaculia bacterium]